MTALAAHAMNPIGSNSVSQALPNTRSRGGEFIRPGLSEAALIEYEEERRPAANRIVVANRGNGPDRNMQIVEEICQGLFDHIDYVMSARELTGHAAGNKTLSGSDLEFPNARPTLIGPEERAPESFRRKQHV